VQSELLDSFTVSLTVRSDALLNNMYLLAEDKHELVPQDGIILQDALVNAFEGESVFDILNREMRAAGIHMSSRRMPAFDSVFVEAINNLYMLDAGPFSGWNYTVNGLHAEVAPDQYILQKGDIVEFIYIIDLSE